MSSLFYENCIYIYEGKNGEKKLLDCNDYLSNKSRISMHRKPEQNHKTLHEILDSLTERERRNGQEFVFSASLIDILLANQLIRNSQPVNMLEYGSGQGRFSWHLAELLGTFHEESTLVCAYDAIDLEWLERISQVEKPPKLSFFAGDFGHLHLQEDFFDIVLINGMVNYTDPYEVVSDALRLAKEDAVILCYTNETPLLESIFCLFFEQREEYEITPSSKVMTAKTKDKCWNGYQSTDFSAQALDHIKQANAICSSKETEKRICFSMLDTLKKDIANAIKSGNICLKLQLVEQKELLLQYTLNQ